MFFTKIKIGASFPVTAISKAFLREDRWDDWGKFRTQFYLVVFDENGKKVELGDVKISHFGLLAGGEISENTRAPVLDVQFDDLDEQYFSLGQTENYYETLQSLSDDLKQKVLIGLRDAAFNLALFEKALSEESMQESLLRYRSASDVRTRLHRLAIGNVVLTPYLFQYIYPDSHSSEHLPHTLTFMVKPNSLPPTNIHVLIGRNGVGKTNCMQNICKSLLNQNKDSDLNGTLTFDNAGLEENTFSGLISVSFSAFDSFDLPDSSDKKIFAYSIGLRYFDDDSGVTRIKTPEMLTKDFVESFQLCRNNKREDRWRTAVTTLSNDPLFEDAGVLSLLDIRSSDSEIEAKCTHWYSKLSSGHKIVLLTVTKLIELVQERTLVLIDEPEGHLHPPLLSAFIRSLSNLLVDRNGVAIIATHSPVVLQEVPKSCAWIINRSGAVTTAIQPSNETFGENVAVLTREVFSFEVTTAGFHDLIKENVYKENYDYEQLLEAFDGQLGAEGKSIAKAMISIRDSINEET